MAAVARLDPRVHRASVYRALDVLRDLGVLEHVHLGHGGTVHHLVAEPEAHGHGQCHRCGALVDLPLRPLLSARNALSEGDRVRRGPGARGPVRHLRGLPLGLLTRGRPQPRAPGRCRSASSGSRACVSS